VITMKYLLRLGTLGVLAAWAAVAQSPADATLQALLTEVRQLRLTVEKSVSLGPRIQLLLQRAQLQDQKVARISQQLDEVRRQIADETKRQTNAAEAQAKFEQALVSESDAERRKQMEHELEDLKVIAARGPDPQLRTREGELASLLQTEQAALDELNGKLDAVERQLEALPATNTPR